jgi:colicin import membrane protein
VKIFDLVAGEGDNWAATEAPALGTPDGVQLKVPATAEPLAKMAEPSPRIAEPEPAPPTPVQPAPIPEATPVPATTAKTTATKTPDLVRTAIRTAAKVEQKIAQQQRMADAVAADKARKEAAAAKKIITKDQYDKLNGNKTSPAGKGGGATKIARIDAKGIAGGVVGGSTANTVGGAGGKALSREEASLMEGYFSFLKQKLEQAHEPPVGVSDKLSVRVEFMLAVDGSISQVRIVRSSGNRDFDQSVLDAFKRVPPIGPRPDGRSEPLILEFKTRDEE